MKKHYRHENDCLNCGSTLEGKYCHNCGQENLEIKESFGHVMGHIVSDYFHFDHEFFHTLKPLLFKPGYLTNQHISGKRVQYLHPVKMYIFISVVYFLLLFQKNENFTRIEEKKPTTDKIVAAREQAKNNVAPANQQGKPAKSDLGTFKDSLKAVKDSVKKNSGAIHFQLWDERYLTYEQYLAAQNKLPEADRDNAITRFFNKKNYDWRKKGASGAETFDEAIEHNTPKMMFILLPLVALIIRIAFWRNKKYYIEHLIYTLHLHCFLFLFMAFIMVVQTVLIPASWEITQAFDFIAGLYVLWYVYRSLRVVYHRGRLVTALKILSISVMYLVAFTACFMILLFFIGITAA